MIQRYEIINHFTSKFEKCKYLEIGSQYRDCFDKVNADLKHDVEPAQNTEPIFKMSSDEFFKKNENIYDVIFVDGLHLCEQVLEDVRNSSNCLSDNGYIILHDCFPTAEIEQLRVQKTATWLGDVWRTQSWLVKRFKNVFTINDSDRGCGIIEGKINFDRKKYTDLFKLGWNDYVVNHETLLRLVMWNEYLNRQKVKFTGTKIIIQKL